MINYFSRQELDSQISNYIMKTDVVVDIGCGIRIQPFFIPKIHICCDPFEPYLMKLATEKEKDRFVYITISWGEFVKLFVEKSVDTIFLLDIVEHIDKDIGVALLHETSKIARKQIIIFTPLGFLPQRDEGVDGWGMQGMYWQQHRCGWDERDFDESWNLYVCKEYHYVDSKLKPFPKPYGAFYAIKNLEG